jgi:hypothetical protein
MGNYPLLNIYRIVLILMIIGLVGYIAIMPQDLYDGGAITTAEYVEAYLPPILAIIGLLATIQVIGTVIEVSNRQHEDHQALLDKQKVLSDQIRQLEKALAEQNSRNARSETPINAVGRPID